MRVTRARPAPVPADIDTRGLERALRRTLQGEVRFDTGSRALYATDASNYRQVPVGVVVPRSAEDVEAAHAAAREFGAPVLARGAGTSLSGETVNVALVIDFSKYLRRILDIDPDARTATVEPGVVHDQLADATGRYGLVFAPDPSTHAYCTIGGNIGNNSCGVHSVQAQFLGPGPRTSDNLRDMEVLTYDGLRLRVGPTPEDELERIIAAGGRRGEIYAALRALRDRYAALIRERFPDIPRRVSGYNLDELLPEKGFNVARALVGTEGTCVSVLEATVELVPDPPYRALVVLGYDDIATAGDHVPALLEHEPLGLEALDERLVRNQELLDIHRDAIAMLPEGGAFLMVELGGDSRDEADERARRVVADCGDAARSVRMVEDPAVASKLWKVREAGLAATAFPPNDDRDHWPGWEDSAVAPEKVGDYVRDLLELYDRYGYHGAIYGHFGQGCVHSRISFDLESTEGIRTFRRFMEDAAELCVSYGGSLSGEHGDGQARAELLPRMYGEELVEAFREFKRIWDPDWKMNPGKVVDPRPLDADLKLHPAAYAPRPVRTHFSYPADRGDFGHVAIRCVGVGKCRVTSGQTMCPSYMVTREEKHTTRGRARMLFEMMQGSLVTDGWRSEEVRDSLELCLSCKGCKRDCPVGVDMATYKAEFLSHHYRGRLRPRQAYTLGLIHWWARLASHVPHIANAATRLPGLAPALKRLGGVAPRRPAPRFAARTLRDRLAARAPADPGGGQVVLFCDTFTNFFEPGVGEAAISVLEALGMQPVVPRPVLCCGRPLFDYGMVGLAKRVLRRTVEQLRPYIVAGVPVVGLEPSCVAALRDELVGLFPDDWDARRLAASTKTFAELVGPRLHNVGWRLERQALYHPHCHHHAVMGTSADLELLGRLGLDVRPSGAGCCGLAGSFGFEDGERFEVSMAIGEHGLAPAVRSTPREDLVIADGFSCRTQISHLTGRRALHLAEVVALAAAHGPQGPPGRPEDALPDPAGRGLPTRAEASLAAAAALLARRWRR